MAESKLTLRQYVRAYDLMSEVRDDVLVLLEGIVEREGVTWNSKSRETVERGGINLNRFGEATIQGAMDFLQLNCPLRADSDEEGWLIELGQYLVTQKKGK
jgi:hypothetical protein